MTRPASVTRKSRNGNSASTPKNVTDPATSISLSLMNRPFRARKNCFQVTPLVGASMSGLFDDPVRLQYGAPFRRPHCDANQRLPACLSSADTRSGYRVERQCRSTTELAPEPHGLLGLQVATHRDDKVHREYLCMRGRNEPSSGCLP